MAALYVMSWWLNENFFFVRPFFLIHLKQEWTHHLLPLMVVCIAKYRVYKDQIINATTVVRAAFLCSPFWLCPISILSQQFTWIISWPLCGFYFWQFFYILTFAFQWSQKFSVALFIAKTLHLFGIFSICFQFNKFSSYFSSHRKFCNV